MNSLLRIPYTYIRPIYEKTSLHQGVISEVKEQKLRASYSICRAITREHAKTFYMATRFLPYHKQRSIFAIYGLCRYLDDLVDEGEDLIRQEKLSSAELLDKLEMFKVKLISTFQGLESDSPVLYAFSDVLGRHEFPIELPLALLEGVRSDLVKNRYENFEELYDYSYKVASVVGLMTSEVFGYDNEEALSYAVDLGIAMQLTNILRDIGEDVDRNRIYLPREDLVRFDVSEDEILNRVMSDRFLSLIQFQIDRAREYYNRADYGIQMLHKDSRLPVLLARENYSRILDKIEESGYNIFHQRAYLTSGEKFSILPKAILKLG